LGILVVLALGIVCCWRLQWTGQEVRHFDFVGLEKQLDTIFADETLARHSFEEDALIPKDYIYFETVNESSMLFSVYIGYYPQQGRGYGKHHDPQVCYPIAGFEILEGPEPVRVGGTAKSEPVVQRLLLSQLGERRVAYYWQQEAGLMAGVQLDTWERLKSGRSDLIWVRVEFLGDDAEGPLDKRWLERIRSTMAAAAASMN
jgi:hypothetical protein